MRRALRAVGAASPETAWLRYLHLSNWSQWAPQIRGVDAPADRLIPGLTGSVRGPLGVRVPFVVLTVDEAGRNWSWCVRVGPAQLRLHHGVQPHPRGSATSLRVDGPAPLVLAYAPIAWFALTRLVRR